jgi:uncharacterized protein YbjT (DUF2867 family)
MLVITAPTGQIGSQVLENVLGSGEQVRVIVRDPSRLSPQTRERVEVVTGSHADAEVVTKAFAGADAVFWLAPANIRAEVVHESYVDFSRAACAAFLGQGVNRVVGISALGRGWAGNAGFVTASLAMDDAIASTGVAYRALANPSFMDNMLRQVNSIRDEGVFRVSMPGDLKAPTCATRDIATVATRLLLDKHWTGTGEVPVLGPEDLSHNDMARIMTEVLGKPVRFEQTAVEDTKAGMLKNGASEAMAQGMVDMVTAKNNGLDNVEPRTPESSTPTSFRQWCEEVLRPAVFPHFGERG